MAVSEPKNSHDEGTHPTLRLQENLIGWLLASRPGVWDAVDQLLPSPRWFDRPYDDVLATLLANREDGLECGPKAIALRLSDHPGLTALGGAEFLSSLASAAPVIIGTEDGANQVEKALLAIRQESSRVTASEFRWKPPAEIPSRKFLFDSRHHVGGQVTITGAPGGGGKTSLCISEVLAHLSGRNLLDDRPLVRGKAWLIFLEDDQEEHQRRISAAMLQHGISEEDVAGRLFVNTATDRDFVLARYDRGQVIIDEALAQGLVGTIREQNITLLVIDPFVAFHQVSENDNSAMDAVVRALSSIAAATGAAIELVHHLRKGNGAEASADDFRGASSIIPAVRSARLLSPMGQAEADRLGVQDRYGLIQITGAKRNMAGRSPDPRWLELHPVDLGNGDKVAAVRVWCPPSPLDGISPDQLGRLRSRIAEGRWREDFRSPDWAGKALAEVLSLDLLRPSDRTRVKRLLGHLLQEKILTVQKAQEGRRKTVKFIVCA